MRVPKPKGKTYPQLRRELKKVFNKYIRESREGCELHDTAKKRGIFLSFKCGGTPTCCHIIPVSRTHTLQFDERNVYRGCSGGNYWEQRNRDLWMKMWPQVWPEKKELFELSKVRVKRDRFDLIVMIQNYKNLIKTLE